MTALYSRTPTRCKHLYSTSLSKRRDNVCTLSKRLSATRGLGIGRGVKWKHCAILSKSIRRHYFESDTIRTHRGERAEMSPVEKPVIVTDWGTIAACCIHTRGKKFPSPQIGYGWSKAICCAHERKYRNRVWSTWPQWVFQGYCGRVTRSNRFYPSTF
jgi:hypothetical protein